MTDAPYVVERRPCAECPYLVSTPPGVWHAAEYEKLATLDNESFHHFMCHHTALGKVDTICRGWLALYPDSIGARILVMDGKLDSEARFDPLPDDVELYASGVAARDAGIAAVDNPSERARRAIDKLTSKRERVRRRAR